MGLLFIIILTSQGENGLDKVIKTNNASTAQQTLYTYMIYYNENILCPLVQD